MPPTVTTDYGNPDIYRTPRYPAGVGEALLESASSAMWDDWDLGGLLVELPHKFAAKAQAKHGIFCSTGTAGLHASLMALELLPGDEVLVPCMTFIRVATPLIHLGLIPVLVDIDPLTGNISAESIANSISEKTRAVIVVHMWGVSADMAAILAITSRHHLKVIEDFSHAHYSEFNGRPVGSFGDVSFASLQRKKTVSVGEGGVIFTSDSDIYSRLRQITSPGSFKNTPNYNEFSGFGLNLRMSPFSAVVANTLFDHLDDIVRSRAAHAHEFSTMLQGFSDHIEPPANPKYCSMISAYGYKPRLTGKTPLSKLASINSRGLWRFSEFSYESIASSPFWSKSRAHYPFCQNIRPIAKNAFPGYLKYGEGRVSLSVPTVPGSYWTDETRAKWVSCLAEALS